DPLQTILSGALDIFYLPKFGGFTENRLFQQPRLFSTITAVSQRKMIRKPMLSQRFLVVAALFLGGSLCSGQKQILSSHLEKYTSPDGAVVAVIKSAKTLEATDESHVELRTKSGKLLMKRDYSS